MARYTITPWKHASDLLAVRQQLYRLDGDASAQADDLRRHAIDRIMAWKLRSNLPHAIESTALLVDAQLHHQNATADTAAHGLDISEFSIRAVYAAAFTRFVTGFCDIGRARERGLEQSSMLAIARQIGMPPEFVALRHEATHEELPGLRRLIAATEKGLEWLWSVYWIRLDEVGEVRGKASETDVRPEILGVLKLHRRERREALRSGRTADRESIKRAATECLSICGGGRMATDMIVDVLVGERLLLPANRTLGEAMDGAYLIWDDLLAKLHRALPSFAGRLTDSLLETVSARDDRPSQGDATQEACSLWVLHLTRSIAADQADSVMQRCCLYPGYWTQVLGQWLLDGGDQALNEDWRGILETSRINAEAGDDMASSNPTAGEMEVDGVDERKGMWSRALLPPSVPIGVIG